MKLQSIFILRGVQNGDFFLKLSINLKTMNYFQSIKNLINMGKEHHSVLMQYEMNTKLFKKYLSISQSSCSAKHESYFWGLMS